MILYKFGVILYLKYIPPSIWLLRDPAASSPNFYINRATLRCRRTAKQRFTNLSQILSVSRILLVSRILFVSRILSPVPHALQLASKNKTSAAVFFFLTMEWRQWLCIPAVDILRFGWFGSPTQNSSDILNPSFCAACPVVRFSLALSCSQS